MVEAQHYDPDRVPYDRVPDDHVQGGRLVLHVVVVPDGCRVDDQHVLNFHDPHG